jgi:phosphoenolpyruvate synthase/pyruvate phosphate dikinase
MFTLDTESGFDQVVFITSAYGLEKPSCRDR